MTDERPRSRARLVGLALAVLALALAAQWWSTRSHLQFGRSVAALAQPGDIQIIVERDCEGCSIARAWMTQYGVAFSECSVETDAECARVRRESGLKWMPLVRVRGELQEGFMPQRIYDRLRAKA
jgi:hypothetical protein